MDFLGELIFKIAVYFSFGRGNVFSVAAVITPRVPSDPTKISFREYPVLSLTSVLRLWIISPLGVTTSRPRTRSLVLP